MSRNEARLHFVAKAAKWSATIEDLIRAEKRGFPDWIQACREAEHAAADELETAQIELALILQRQERRCVTAA